MGSEAEFNQVLINALVVFVLFLLSAALCSVEQANY